MRFGLGLDSLDGANPVGARVKGGHRLHARRLGTYDEVGLGDGVQRQSCSSPPIPVRRNGRNLLSHLRRRDHRQAPDGRLLHVDGSSPLRLARSRSATEGDDRASHQANHRPREGGWNAELEHGEDSRGWIPNESNHPTDHHAHAAQPNRATQ